MDLNKVKNPFTNNIATDLSGTGSLDNSGLKTTGDILDTGSGQRPLWFIKGALTFNLHGFNGFQTELTSHTKVNNQFETVSFAVDRLPRPCPF